MKTIEELERIYNGLDGAYAAAHRPALQAVADAVAPRWIPVTLEVKKKMTFDPVCRLTKYLVLNKLSEMHVIGGASFGLADITHYKPLPDAPKEES